MADQRALTDQEIARLEAEEKANGVALSDGEMAKLEAMDKAGVRVRKPYLSRVAEGSLYSVKQVGGAAEAVARTAAGLVGFPIGLATTLGEKHWVESHGKMPRPLARKLLVLLVVVLLRYCRRVSTIRK